MKTNKYSTLKTLLGCLFIFNVLDGLFTLFFLSKNIAEEANPIMALAYSCSPVLFIGIKVLWIGFNLMLLWGARRSLKTSVVWILVLAFVCLLGYELLNFVQYLVG